MKRKSVKALRKMSIADLEIELIECHGYEADIVVLLQELKGQCLICSDEYCELDNGICESCTMEFLNV